MATSAKKKVVRRSNKGQPQGQIRVKTLLAAGADLDGRTAVRVDWDGFVAPVQSAIVDENGHLVIKVRVDA